MFGFYFNKSVIPYWFSLSFFSICSRFCLSHWQFHVFVWFRLKTFDSLMISLTCRPSKNLISSNSKICSESNPSPLPLLMPPQTKLLSSLPWFISLSAGFSASVLGSSDPVKALKIVHNEFPIPLTVKVEWLQCFTRFCRIWPLLCLRLHFFPLSIMVTLASLLLLNYVSLLPYQYFYTCYSLSLKCSSPHGSLSHLLRLIQRPS